MLDSVNNSAKIQFKPFLPSSILESILIFLREVERLDFSLVPIAI